VVNHNTKVYTPQVMALLYMW